jgi:hypothetical protein
MVYLRTMAVQFAVIVSACNGLAQEPNRADEVKPPSVDELLLFFPSKHPAGNWTPTDLRFVDVPFSSEDKTRLHGWYCPCDEPRATILIAHGNAGHVASRAAWLKHQAVSGSQRTESVCRHSRGGPQSLAHRGLPGSAR